MDEPIHWALIRMAHRTVADLSLIPMQDVLGLGSEARMNTPGKMGGNWTWRFTEDQIDPDQWAKLKEMTRAYGRIKLEKEDESRPEWM